MARGSAHGTGEHACVKKDTIPSSRSLSQRSRAARVMRRRPLTGKGRCGVKVGFRRLYATTITAFLAFAFLVTAVSDAWSVTLYSVRPKDTIAKIARRQGVSVERILRANPELGHRMTLKIGQIIVVPDREEIVTREDDDETPARPTAPLAVSPIPVRTVAETKIDPVPPPPAVVMRPMPVPTPVAQNDDVPVATPGYENLAVVNAQDIRVIAGGEAARHRPLLASRRGRLMTRITEMARHFIGVPYVWGGTSPHGLDCSGFTMRVYKMAGITIRRLADEQYYQGKPTSSPLPGDLVFFHTYLPGPSHVGIYLGSNTFIHASSRRGVTISSLGDPYYRSRYLGARRFF